MKKIIIEVYIIKDEILFFQKDWKRERILPYVFALFASSLNYFFSISRHCIFLFSQAYPKLFI